MKVSIIYFSPGGSTRKIAEKIQQFAPNNVELQLLDITGKSEIFRGKLMKTYLEENLQGHDLLIVGSPVYAHHIQYHMIDLIKQLPKVSSKFGAKAATYVTYGDVSSGIALNEVNMLLKKQGRKVITGMRITTEHSLTRLLNSVINPGKPGDEVDELIKEFWKNINQRFETIRNNRKIMQSMNFQPFKDKVKAYTIFCEKLWQNYLYPKIQFHHEKCNLCQKCINNCPVNHLELHNGKITEISASACITCGNCVVGCPKNAITMKGNIDKFGEMIEKYKAGKSNFASNEYPKNKLF